MALNLSTLTSPANSSVLEEVNTTADFLESVPVFRNLSRSSNRGSDAKQSVALNQPKALPLIDGDGYLYVSGVSGNYAEIDTPILPATGDFDLTIDFVWKDTGVNNQDLFGQYTPSIAGRFFIYVTPAGELRVFWNGAFGHDGGLQGSIIEGRRHVARFNRTGNTFTVYLDGASYYSATVLSTVPILQVNSTLGFAGTRSIHTFKGAIFSVTEGSNTNVDFTATSVRHGATKFACATGQVVTINQDSSSSNDVATIIKKPVLRFSTATSGLKGLFANQIDGGYMFAAFSVLGTGVASGESSGRVFSINKTGGEDFGNGGAMFAAQNGTTTTLRSRLGDTLYFHSDLYDDTNGDILHESKLTQGAQLSRVNNADLKTNTNTTVLEGDEFNIGVNEDGVRVNGENAAIDLEYLALFPATITDAQAADVVNYINNRNNVFSLVDGFGYYFYDAQKAPVGNISSGSASWNGRIVGSDNGDTDKLATQATANDQPVGDGYVVTFADNSDHLEIPQVTLAAGDSYAWMVCGTSLGTFAYKVTVSGQTELTLLGHLGNASYRKAGDLYGIILLPESATGADIEAARKLLIDRGAADGATASDYFAAWYQRNDMVEFKSVDMTGVSHVQSAWNGTSIQSFDTPLPQVTNGSQAWYTCSSLTTFSTELPVATNVSFAWYNNTSLSEFRTTDIKNCADFTSTWQGCSALQSFPAGAKLGTEATNVNFTSAWQSSGLTSFPALDLSNGNIFANAFRGTAITQFPSDALLGADKTNVNFNSAFRSSDIISFSTPLPTGNTFADSFKYCDDLTDVSVDVFTNWNPSTIANACFNDAWTNCTALTAQSVENILVSLNNSGQHATSDGDAYVNGVNTQLADAGIDIDYNGDPLSAATTAAIDSLSGKGWEVFINGVLVIPNILDLQPAAAYSLRSFDADADPNVVNVRRSSDSALRDFTASEVSDGTLTDWVNTEYETVINGEFTTDSDWSKGSGWDIANGKATSDGTQTGVSFLSQASNMGASQSQRVTLVVSGYTAGTVRVRLGGSAPNSSITSAISSNGTHVFTLPSHSDPSILFIEASADFQGSLESISVVQLTADGHVTKWHDQREIVETGSAYGTTISGTADGAATTHNQIAPAVAGEFYRVRFTASNLSPRGRLRFRSYAGNANITVSAGLASMAYFSANGEYEAYVPSDDGLSLYFYADVGQSFDYSGVSVQQIAEVPNNATQTSGSAQPKIVDGGTLVTDGSGNPAIIGDGVDDTLFHPTLTNELDSSDFLVTAAYKDDLAMGIEGSCGQRKIM